MNTLGKVGLAAGALLVAVFVWRSDPDTAPPASGTAPAAKDPLVAAGLPAAPPGDAANGLAREAVAAPGAGALHPPAPASPKRLHGRVIDLAGQGVAGVRLVPSGDLRRPDSAAEISNLGGAFQIDLSAGVDSIVAQDDRWSTVLAGSTAIQTDQPSIVVVAPRIAFGGRVLDANGAPLPGAAVTLHMPSHFGADFGILLDHSLTRTWRAVCDAEGRFALVDVPAVAAATVSAVLGGYLPCLAPLPRTSALQVEIVLERPGRDATVVDGIVVDVWGAGVAGARVSAGMEVSITDACGAFTIDVSSGRDLARLVAAARGWQPAVFVPERDAAGKPQWPDRVVLQLGPAPLSIRGRVFAATGQPAAGAKVWIADPLVIGYEQDAVLAETLLGRTDHPFWAFVLADETGVFRIDGLTDRPYEVRALDLETLQAVTRTGVAAGSAGIELHFDGDLFAELRGRVVARDGSPIAGVKVNLQRPALEVRVPGGTRDEWAAAPSVLTDENGAFAFRRVPRQGVEVFAKGDSIMFAGRMVAPGDDPLAFELQVDRRVHVQIEVAPPVDRVDRARVLDPAGQAMLLRVMRGESAHTNRSAAIENGRSQILSLGEGAASIVFYRGEEEIGRLPVRLAPGAVNTVRF